MTTAARTADFGPAPTSAALAPPHDRPAVAGAVPARHAITFTADMAELDRLAWRHMVLTVATLGLFSVWAKVAWRQSLWQAIRIDGVPLRYTGTVWEALRPLILVALGLAAFVIALLIAKWFAVPTPRVTPSPWRLLVTLPLVYVIGLSVWGARGHLLSRTEIGGTAGALIGSRHRYAALHFATALMMGPSMGFALPWRQAWLQRALVEGMQLGPHRFTFDPRPGALVRRYLVVWMAGIATYLGVVLTIAFSTIGAKVVIAKETGQLPALTGHEIGLGMALAVVAAVVFMLIAAWYRAGVLRHFASAIRIDGRRLQLDLPTGAFVRRSVLSKILKILSLGLLAPICEAREMRDLIGRFKTE